MYIATRAGRTTSKAQIVITVARRSI